MSFVGNVAAHDHARPFVPNFFTQSDVRQKEVSCTRKEILWSTASVKRLVSPQSDGPQSVRLVGIRRTPNLRAYFAK
jgi:hypothetical protein